MIGGRAVRLLDEGLEFVTMGIHSRTGANITKPRLRRIRNNTKGRRPPRNSRVPDRPKRRSQRQPTSFTTWSAGMTMRTGSSPSASSAAKVSAGAVLRPTGSRMMLRAAWPLARSCSATRKRCASLHTISGDSSSAASPRLSMRAAVDCNSESSPTVGGTASERRAAKAATIGYQNHRRG